jgi:CRP-like cAMP-binding protein
MADRFVVTNARRLPLFARLDAQQMDWVASVTQVLHFEPGEEMFKQGEPAQGMLMVISGGGLLVQRGTDGIERPFGKVSAGEFINDNALFNDITTQATLRATESSIVLFLSRQQMRNLLAHHPEIRANLNMPALPKTQTQQVQQFQNQRENENTLLKTRRHIGAFLSRAIGIGVVILVIWFAAATMVGLAPGFPSLLIALIATAVLGLLIVYHYIEWSNDELIITDRRVISIQRTILNFKTRVNEIPLDAIHEVNVAMPAITNVVGRMLGYGSIIIKTSGDANNIRLDEIPNPKAVQQAIFTNRQKYQQAQLEENRNAMRGEMAKVIGGEPGASTAAGTGAPPGVTSRPGLFTLEYTNQKGETVYRKHWLVLLAHIIPGGLLFMAGVALLLLIGTVSPFIPFGMIGLSVLWLYIADWDWRNDMYIIGDQTVTIVHRRPIFLQDQKDQILLAQIDNVVSDTQGFMNSIFQIGEVKLLLTGMDEKNAKRFTNVYNPQRIQQEISRRQDRAEDLKRREEAQRQQQAIVDYLSVYHETVGTPPPAVNGAGQPLTPAQPANTYPAQAAKTQTGTNAYVTDEDSPQPPRVRDRSRPPGIPRVRRDVPPGS